MILRIKEVPTFKWIDVVDPTPEELREVSDTYNLHPTSVQDCLDPEHLPKFEKISGTYFLMTRCQDDDPSDDHLSIQNMTRKTAVFWNDNLVLTIHRRPLLYLDSIFDKWRNETNLPESVALHIVSDVVRGQLKTFDQPLDILEKKLTDFEFRVYDKNDHADLVEDIYFTKRKLNILKRLFRLTSDTMQRVLINDEKKAPIIQDLREEAESYSHFTEDLLETANNLIHVQIQLAGHRQNEVIRVLTLFSVFFLPLNFIAGIYGMNFENMPELKWPNGYFMALSAMTLVSITLAFWFYKKGWLKN